MLPKPNALYTWYLSNNLAQPIQSIIISVDSTVTNCPGKIRIDPIACHPCHRQVTKISVDTFDY